MSGSEHSWHRGNREKEKAKRLAKTLRPGLEPKKKKYREEGEKRRSGVHMLWRKLLARPLRIWPLFAVLGLVLVVLWLMPASRQEAPPLPTPTGVADSGPGPSGVLGSATPDGAVSGEAPILLRGVRLLPPHPTRLDLLKAEVDTLPAAAENLTFTYQWRVNDHVVPGADGDTLALMAFKKRDLVSVTVTPYAGQRAGVAVQSPLVLIQSVPPTLELADVRQRRKAGAPIELQLLGTAPDGEIAGFSLEEPHVAGMTLDSRSGKIVWLLQPGQGGTIRFGASVVDDSGAKITKIYEITVE